MHTASPPDLFQQLQDPTNMGYSSAESSRRLLLKANGLIASPIAAQNMQNSVSIDFLYLYLHQAFRQATSAVPCTSKSAEN